MIYSIFRLIRISIDTEVRTLVNIFKAVTNQRFPCGLTVRDAKRWLRKNTHCGKYWKVKPEYDPYKNITFIYMEGNEYVSIDMNNKHIDRVDFD